MTPDSIKLGLKTTRGFRSFPMTKSVFGNHSLYIRPVDEGRHYRFDLYPPHLYVQYNHSTSVSRIMFFNRYQLHVACIMDFSQYPIDTQTCHLEFTQSKPSYVCDVSCYVILPPVPQSKYRFVWGEGFDIQKRDQDRSVGAFLVKTTLCPKSYACKYGIKEHVCLCLEFIFERKFTTALIKLCE